MPLQRERTANKQIYFLIYNISIKNRLSLLKSTEIYFVFKQQTISSENTAVTYILSGNLICRELGIVEDRVLFSFPMSPGLPSVQWMLSNL